MKKTHRFSFFLILLANTASAQPLWNANELAVIKAHTIQTLPPLPENPTNKYATHPQAITLGHHLFFDKRLSANGKISCANCHQPEKLFTDGRKKGKAIGETRRNTPSIIGIAYSPWFFWDGRSDSLWSQPLDPLEAHNEHGGNRMQYARLIYHDPIYKKWYEEIFGTLPDLTDSKRFPEDASPVGSHTEKAKWQTLKKSDQYKINQVFANLGKAIAAYERQILPGKSRFDRYVETLEKADPINNIFNQAEVAGLRLFIGKGKCATCHTGPLFTNHSFHNIGTPHPESRKPSYIPAIIYRYMKRPETDQGRYEGLPLARSSTFNCSSLYSDGQKDDCAELKYANTDHRITLGAFKVPSLRNVSHTAPYMHSGVFPKLKDVLKHYSHAPMAPTGHSEITPLDLSDQEIEQLVAFLKTLESPLTTPDRLLRPPVLNVNPAHRLPLPDNELSEDKEKSIVINQNQSKQKQSQQQHKPH